VTTSRSTRVALVLSVILFAASLTQDAFCVSGICSDWPGWSILLFGALGHTSWFANPLLLASWIAALFARRIPALLLSLAALGLGGSFMFETSVITNEAGMANPVTGLREGYWLWLAGMGGAVGAAGLAQVVVLMVPTTAPEDIAAYANRVGNTWKIGRAGVGDGLILLVALKDRRLRIEVAKTLEGVWAHSTTPEEAMEKITAQWQKGLDAG